MSAEWWPVAPYPVDTRDKVREQQLVIERARHTQSNCFVETSDEETCQETTTKVTDKERRAARFRKMVKKIAILGTPRKSKPQSNLEESSGISPRELLPYHSVMTQRLMASSTSAIAFDLQRAFTATRKFVQRFESLGESVFKNQPQSSISNLFDVLRCMLSEAHRIVESMAVALRKMSKVDAACAFRSQLPASSLGGVAGQSAKVTRELSDMMTKSRGLGDQMVRETYLLERIGSPLLEEQESLHGMTCIYDVLCRMTGVCDAFRDIQMFISRLRVFFEDHFEGSEAPVQLNLFEEISVCQLRMAKLTLHQFLDEARKLVETIGDHMQYLANLPRTS